MNNTLVKFTPESPVVPPPDIEVWGRGDDAVVLGKLTWTKPSNGFHDGYVFVLSLVRATDSSLTAGTLFQIAQKIRELNYQLRGGVRLSEFRKG